MTSAGPTSRSVVVGDLGAVTKIQDGANPTCVTSFSTPLPDRSVSYDPYPLFHSSAECTERRKLTAIVSPVDRSSDASCASVPDTKFITPSSDALENGCEPDVDVLTLVDILWKGARREHARLREM